MWHPWRYKDLRADVDRIRTMHNRRIEKHEIFIAALQEQQRQQRKQMMELEARLRAVEAQPYGGYKRTVEL